MTLLWGSLSKEVAQAKTKTKWIGFSEFFLLVLAVLAIASATGGLGSRLVGGHMLAILAAVVVITIAFIVLFRKMKG